MELGLEGRTAIVTGAAQGIGRAHALRLASHGASVLVNDLGVSIDGAITSGGGAGGVVAEIEAAGGRAVADGHDVSSFAGGEAIVAAALDAFGRVDIVVNNAGIAADAPITEMTEELLLRLVRVHYVGAVGVCRAALPHLVGQRWGRIVNTVSEAALDSRFPGGVAYGGAKGAVWAATLAMARQVAGTGVTVNGLSPGARTRMSADLLDRTGSTLDLDPDHVARVVAVLVSEGAAHLNGVVVHAAAGAVREYTVSRTFDTPTVAWLAEAVSRL